MQLENYDNFPTTLPLIIEDDIFLYPFMIAPIFVTDEANIASVTKAMEQNQLVMVSVTKPNSEGGRESGDFYDVGVVGTIMRRVALPDGKIKILFQGLTKGKIVQVHQNEKFLSATIEQLLPEPYNTQNIQALLEALRDNVSRLSKLNTKFPVDLVKTIDDNSDPVRITDLISSVLKLNKNQTYTLFKETNLENKILLIIEHIKIEIENIKIQKEINQKVNAKIEKNHKDYFLKEQIKALQKELGNDNIKDKDIKNYKIKLKEIKDFMGKDAYKETKKQIDKLSRLHQDSPDASLLQTYIETVLEIPFGKYADEEILIETVEAQLNKDHYSLKEAKERIVEFFAVKELLEIRKIKDSKAKGTVLCFVGPPGVGKTSLANSISQALQRPLLRIALGGLEDVNELRGHRRTYVGAMPGRLVSGLINSKKMNPVVVLDEIDKIGSHHKGDPTAVMLEVLDPEQNHEFRDLYLNFSIDLSQCIFVATANEIRNIPAPLRDRMEFITVSSYTPNEKYHIAVDYLIPQELVKHGLKKSEVNISKNTIELIIQNYTREAGVRNLRRVFAKIFRKVAKKLLQQKDLKKVSISTKNIKEFLDKAIFDIDICDKTPQIGITNGLAWTSVGGDVLKIEAIKLKGKGVLSLTGSMGEVMKESAKISHSVVKLLIDTNKIKVDLSKIPLSHKEKEEAYTPDTSDIYQRYDIHLHIPEGATPKDGPSAGITMATTLASILSDKEVKNDIAMTGELTLSGKVLAIGGLKEKLIAAHKAKIKSVLIPRKNYENDLDDIPDEVKKDLDIIAVDTIEDVLKLALIQ